MKVVSIRFFYDLCETYEVGFYKRAFWIINWVQRMLINRLYA